MKTGTGGTSFPPTPISVPGFKVPPSQVVTAIGLAVIGVALVAAAIAANQCWLDRHFLPSFFLTHHQYMQIQTYVRVAVAVIGVSLTLMARSVARVLTVRTARHALLVVIAVILALIASELALRHWHVGPAAWLFPEDEPRRLPDPRIGWTLVPSRIGHKTIAGRAVEYAIDSAGYRVRTLNEPVDPERPSILFAGESMMFGEGLDWAESVPAQVGALRSVQSVNMAVHGFSTDQIYLRLQKELPRFRNPVAVVSLFTTTLFGRNLNDDRPHLGPDLIWLPAVQHSRMQALAMVLVPFRRDATVERGITMTREALVATVELARARGAIPLIVVPQFGGEEDTERMLRRRILGESSLPYVVVDIDESWRLPWDQHPDARASRVIANAIAARLQAP